MFIARWHVKARFGYKQKVIDLMKQWMDEVGSKAGWTSRNSRLTTGSIGAKEAEIQNDLEVKSLAELEAAFEKIGKMPAHADWSKEMEKYVVSGSTYWDILRVVE